MRCTIKSIVKFGLIAEIITAMIGTIGEYSIRYRYYKMAMDELFGLWYEPTPEKMAKIYAHHHHHIDWPSNHQHYDHRTGESYRLSQLNQLAMDNENDDNENINDNNSNDNNQTFFSKFILRLSLWLFPHNHHTSSSSSSSSTNNILNNKSTYSTTTIDNIEDDEPLDPRPLIILSILIILNVIFIFSVIIEFITLISMMAFTWILYIILLFVVVRVMNDDSSLNNDLDQLNSTIQWSTLLPSPFILLVVTIILLFTFILIALITEERRQIAARIRARSACIPLVKSRDMDLNDI